MYRCSALGCFWVWWMKLVPSVEICVWLMSYMCDSCQYIYCYVVFLWNTNEMLPKFRISCGFIFHFISLMKHKNGTNPFHFSVCTEHRNGTDPFQWNGTIPFHSTCYSTKHTLNVEDVIKRMRATHTTYSISWTFI